MVSSENTPCSTAAASTQSHIEQGTRKIPVAVLLGPTAVGKSSLAIKLAEDLDFEIISCDSRQIYCGMDIGTAKVSAKERMRVPHWLIDVVHPDEAYSAFRFAQEASAIIRERSAQGKNIILCGGTGLYFKVLAQGGIECVDSDPALRKELTEFADAHGNSALHDLLTEADHVSAERLHPNDRQRVIRALSIFRQTGKTLSSFRSRQATSAEFSFTVVKLTMPRESLYERINRRVEKMAAEGLYSEFLALRSRGVGDHAPGMQTVGYRELFPVERGECTLAEAVTQIQIASRHYAKRQQTWFSTQTQGITITQDDSYSSIRSYVSDAFRVR